MRELLQPLDATLLLVVGAEVEDLSYRPVLSWLEPRLNSSIVVVFTDPAFQNGTPLVYNHGTRIKGGHMKSLVVFYSLTGKTRLAAQTICESLNAEIAEVQEVRARTMGFSVYLAGGFAAMTNKGSRIKPMTVDVSRFDRVFVGSPVWASRPAPAINSFIYATDLKGRTVIPFVTLGGESSRPPLANMTAKIQKRGGNVPGSFAVTTNRVSDEEIRARIRDAVKQFSE